jgi:hypothetical protein
MEDVKTGPVLVTEAIQVPAEDLELVHQACAAIEVAQAELGAEYERHMREAARLKERIDDARRSYRVLVEVLAKKHVKVAGEHDFRPDIGAFVRTRSGT